MSCVHIVLSFASACTGADVRGLGGEQECTLTGHSNYVTSVAYSPDGKHIVSGSGDRTVKIWDTAMGEEVSHRVFPSLYYLLLRKLIVVLTYGGGLCAGVHADGALGLRVLGGVLAGRQAHRQRVW